ncbi:HET-domain-containing protein, partial [Zopfia rhizophila CBS 207.26]
MPTRVVDLTSHTDVLRLKVSAKPSDKYAALSYCWGWPQPDCPEFVTTKENVTRRESGFALTDLPLTLRDAVTSARSIGFSYLWIDALCIVQDDEDDWSRESATMGSIYKNADLTIIARTGVSSWDGFLSPPTAKYQTGQVSFTIPGNLPGQRRRGILWLSCRGSAGQLANTPYHWENRGWTFQEELLSTRVLFCSGYSWYNFSCLTSRKRIDQDVKEVDNYYRPRPWIRRSLKIPQHIFRGSPYDGWYEIVNEYGSRYFTNREDKLPALSGIAERLADAVNDRYVAGLWEKDLFFGL